MAKKVCVYCASSPHVPQLYLDAARAFGQGLGKRGFDLVYGGGANGLMGEVAKGAMEEGSFVTGVFPQSLFTRFGREIILESVDEIISVQTMAERKAVMAERSNIFVALPGGMGTFEEIIEMLSHRQLHLHDKPCLFVNLEGYFQGILDQFEKAFELQFTREEYRRCYQVAENVDQALDMISL